MGIQGLLPLLKDVQTPINVSKYKGQTLGIDGYVWLHRGAYGCAESIVMGQSTTQYTKYAMHRIRMLRHHGITPYVVFDGDRLPSKAGTEEDREARRSENLARAKSLIKGGRQGTAFDAFAKCIDITPEMAYQLIKCLKAEGVPFLVAPYEADAQLAYLEKVGIIDAVVTEDSDLLVFGCRKVLFKMDSNGDCIEILSSRLTACKTLSFAGWTTDLFRQMAILSGCDYLPSIPGMGLKNAYKLLQRYKTVKRALQAVRLEGKMRVPPDYQTKFEQAEKTFLYQRVWCPRREELTTLSPLNADEAAIEYVGPEMHREIARGIARGLIDPISRSPMVDIAPGVQIGSRRSTSSPSTLQENSTKLAQNRLSQGQTTLNFAKRPGGPAKTKSISMPTIQGPRKPLAQRNLNTDSSRPAPSTPVKSPFFGGHREQPAPSVGNVGRTARSRGCKEQEDASPFDLISHPNAALSPISGIGDYFCELDGADPRLLVSEDESVKTKNRLDTGEEGKEEGEDESFDWAGRDCASVVSSDDAGTTPKKRTNWQETSPVSSLISSPSTDIDDLGLNPTKGKPEGPQQPEGESVSQCIPEASLGGVISSPVQEIDASQPSRRLGVDLENAVAESHKRPRLTEDIEQGDEDDIGSALADASPSLWAKYRHQDSRDVLKEPVTPVRPRSLLRTPINRPLRLYAFQSPAERSPFPRPGMGSDRKNETPVSAPSRSILAFQPRSKDSENPSSVPRSTTPLVPTPGSKRKRMDHKSFCSSSSSSKPKLTISKSVSTSALPLSTIPNPNPNNPQVEDSKRCSPLSAFRYSETSVGAKRSLSMSTLPAKPTVGGLSRTEDASDAPVRDDKGAVLDVMRQREGSRGVLLFESSAEEKRAVGGGRPSLDRFKFRTS